MKQREASAFGGWSKSGTAESWLDEKFRPNLKDDSQTDDTNGANV
ncbi:hypothetical protein [uncultured Treponema sp.]|nr:hypothetical protein [uncultured Treponema sp.]